MTLTTTLLVIAGAVAYTVLFVGVTALLDIPLRRRHRAWVRDLERSQRVREMLGRR